MRIFGSLNRWGDIVLIEGYEGLDIRLGRPYLNMLEKIGRSVGRFLPHKQYPRSDGVSALFLIRDEPLAYDSIRSILPLVDEVVVVDCGRQRPVLPSDKKIVYVHTPPEQDSQAKIGMILSRYRWVLRWDGDFLPTEETKKIIEYARDLKQGYWQIRCMVANTHNNQVDYLQKESYLFTYHPCILTAKESLLKQLFDVAAKIRGGLPGRICYGTLPYFFGQHDLDMVLAYHYYKHKSMERLFEREHQAYWSLMSDKDRVYHGSYEKYLQKMREWSG